MALDLPGRESGGRNVLRTLRHNLVLVEKSGIWLFPRHEVVDLRVLDIVT